MCNHINNKCTVARGTHHTGGDTGMHSCTTAKLSPAMSSYCHGYSASAAAIDTYRIKAICHAANTKGLTYIKAH